MAKLLTDSIMILLLSTTSISLGCGVMPPVQVSTRLFTVSGFTLPVPMVYSTTAGVFARVPGIASSRDVAQGFVSRLIMQTVSEVLESQARSALLPEGVISVILSQLDVTVTYEPMLCQNVALSLMEMVGMATNPHRCIIVGDTVTGICSNTKAGDMPCTTPNANVEITSVPANFTSIQGSLRTTNFIMANWSRAMWQSVVSRALRVLASGPFGSNFFSATGAVGGN